jgi:enhancing lycopene biosynthesis protein 2
MKAGIVLSGCGVRDGSEIHEAVLTMLHLDQAGTDMLCMAPAIDQHQVVNHLSNEACAGEHRNVLTEAARIARGDIRDMRDVHAADIDALIFPGGFGAALNLCSFAADGPNCRVNVQVERLLMEMLDARKPVGALCIAPVIIARVAGSSGRSVQLTIGSDPEVARAIETMGARHIDCAVDTAVVDREHRVVTSPAYMLAGSISEVSKSAQALVSGIMELAAP